MVYDRFLSRTATIKVTRKKADTDTFMFLLPIGNVTIKRYLFKESPNRDLTIVSASIEKIVPMIMLTTNWMMKSMVSWDIPR